MSKVKLIVVKRHSLHNAEMRDIKIELPEDTKITGIVRSDFEEAADGTKRDSDDIDLVITWDNINNLVGQLLTLVDATFSDGEQRKAMKDIFMDRVWKWYEATDAVNVRAWRVDKGIENN